jgi:hypothetical protein
MDGYEGTPTVFVRPGDSRAAEDDAAMADYLDKLKDERAIEVVPIGGADAARLFLDDELN